MAGRCRRAAPRVLISASVVLAIATAAVSAVTAAAQAQSQTAQQTNGAATKLKPIRVEAPKKRPRPATTRGDRAAPAVPGDSAAQSSEQPGQGGGAGTGAGTGTDPGAGAAATPLNGNAVAASASLLDLPIREIPASVEVVSRQQINEQGYRTTTETAIRPIIIRLSGTGSTARPTRSIWRPR
jgi:iron complex outermembrane recepter protein